MTARSARAVCLDASVLVKLRLDEPHSNKVREWCEKEPGAYTTPFCFYEALNIFKSKWKHQGKISREEYLSACNSLVAWFGGISRRGFVKDSELITPAAFTWVREVVSTTGLDFSDAYQLYSVKHGYFSVLANDSRTVLATTDAELARVSRTFGLLSIDLAVETTES
jgi:predicted nucleic acid-binding protein